MSEFYFDYLPFIFAVHIFSAVIWVGGMINFSFAVYPSVLQIPNEKMFVRTSLRTLNRFFKLLLPVSILLGLSGYLMAVGKDFAHRDPVLSVIVTSKIYIWFFMIILYSYSFYKIKESKKRCLASDIDQAKDNIKLIAWYLFGISALLGLVAIYFGFILRGV